MSLDLTSKSSHTFGEARSTQANWGSGRARQEEPCVGREVLVENISPSIAVQTGLAVALSASWWS